MDESLVCFMCARCKQLVKLDSSFDSIDDQTMQDLVLSSRATASPIAEGISNEDRSTNECQIKINVGFK